MPYHSDDNTRVQSAAARRAATPADLEEYIDLSLIDSQDESDFTGLDYYEGFEPSWSDDIRDNSDTELAEIYVTHLSNIPDGGMGVGRLRLDDDYDEEVYLLHTVGVTDPTITQSSNYTYTTYTDAEETELTARFGSNIGYTDEDLAEIVEDYVYSAVQEIAATALKPQFSFKKVKYKRLDYDHLSSFEESEVAQTTGASLVRTAGSGEGTSY